MIESGEVKLKQYGSQVNRPTINYNILEKSQAKSRSIKPTSNNVTPLFEKSIWCTYFEPTIFRSKVESSQL